MLSKENIREFIVRELIPGINPEDLSDDLDLIDAGIIDSLDILKLVDYIEKQIHTSLDPDDIANPDRLNSIEKIFQLILLCHTTSISRFS